MTDATRIAVAIVVAALAIALALYARPVTERYRFKIVNQQVQRFDTVTGEMLFCRARRCHRYDRDGTISNVGRDLLAIPPPKQDEDFNSFSRIVENGYTLTPVDGDPFANEVPEDDRDSELRDDPLNRR